MIPNKELGHDTIINVDYSSQEAHLAAIVAKDKDMIRSFMSGEDVHKATAALMSGVPYDEVTKDQRSAAKKITFGLMYGKTPAGYAADEGITIEEAERKFEEYFRGKPLIKQAIDDAQEFVRQHAYIEMPISGFQRKLEGINSSSKQEQQKALRQGFNSVIQGGSAAISTKALILVNRWLKTSPLNARVMVTVHDSITISTTKEDAKAVAIGTKYLMEHLPIPEIQFRYRGKLVTDFMQATPGFGKNYGFEAEVEPEEFDSFKSTEDFYDYYYARKLVSDKQANGLITERELKTELANLESAKYLYLK